MLQQRKESGLSVKEWCREQGLAEHTQDRGRFSVLTGEDTEPSETTEKVVFLSHYSQVVTVKFYELE